MYTCFLKSAQNPAWNSVCNGRRSISFDRYRNLRLNFEEMTKDISYCSRMHWVSSRSSIRSYTYKIGAK